MGSYGASAATPAASAYPAKVRLSVTAAVQTLHVLTMWCVIGWVCSAGHVCRAQSTGVEGIQGAAWLAAGDVAL